VLARPSTNLPDRPDWIAVRGVSEWVREPSESLLSRGGVTSSSKTLFPCRRRRGPISKHAKVRKRQTYHLYTFTSVLTATLFRITTLYKAVPVHS
jgi:hypothetical protein